MSSKISALSWDEVADRILFDWMPDLDKFKSPPSLAALGQAAKLAVRLSSKDVVQPQRMYVDGGGNIWIEMPDLWEKPCWFFITDDGVECYRYSPAAGAIVSQKPRRFA